MNDLVSFNSFGTLESIVTELLGEWNYGIVNHVTFRTMYGGGRISGAEISIQDRDPYKKIFRRVFADKNQQISTKRLLMAYEELKSIYNSTIACKDQAREIMQARLNVYNDLARSLKEVKSLHIFGPYSFDEGDFSMSLCGSEELIIRTLLFLEQECGKKEMVEENDDEQ
jgi:hypothetical protein